MQYVKPAIRRLVHAVANMNPHLSRGGGNRPDARLEWCTFAPSARQRRVARLLLRQNIGPSFAAAHVAIPLVESILARRASNRAGRKHRALMRARAR